VALVVSDTSPIRALDHLNLLPLLKSLFDEVVIPPAAAERGAAAGSTPST
jgi:predicted nucleic acid-binding protein